MKRLLRYRPWVGIPLWIAFCVWVRWHGWDAIWDIAALFAVTLWAIKYSQT